ncbi:hypothetical protein [Streptomyces sp. NPDC057702]|uniref:hypothetical protein n=1 Tax=unclassified Streptomyces TaxID=2593676 RepID=UPI0036B80F80
MSGGTKATLWLLFGLCVGINVILSVTLDGSTEMMLSAVAGVCALAAVVGLTVARRGR